MTVAPCRFTWPFAVALLMACNHPANDGPATPPAPSASVAAPRPSASAGSPVKAAPVVWNGSYKSKAGSLYVYDGGEWKGFHFRGDDAGAGLGEGTLSLSFDLKTSTIHGTSAGPLGDLLVAGALDGKTGEVTFSLVRKDPADRGFTGTGVGHLAERGITGTMRLSRGDAHVIREATFSLSPAATP